MARQRRGNLALISGISRLPKWERKYESRHRPLPDSCSHARSASEPVSPDRAAYAAGRFCLRPASEPSEVSPPIRRDDPHSGGLQVPAGTGRTRVGAAVAWPGSVLANLPGDARACVQASAGSCPAPSPGGPPMPVICSPRRVLCPVAPASQAGVWPSITALSSRLTSRPLGRSSLFGFTHAPPAAAMCLSPP